MTFHTKALLFSAALLAIAPAWSKAEDKAQVDNRLDEAAEALQSISVRNERGIPARVISEAKCIAIVPRLTSAALVVGGEYGKGVVTCQRNGQWSAPSFFTISGGSIGIQIGFERTDLILLVMNNADMKKFPGGQFRLAASAALATGQKGSGRAEDTRWSGIVAYGYSKGAFVGLDVKGVLVSEDDDAISALYGTTTDNQQILDNLVPVPQGAAQAFVTEARLAQQRD